MSEHRLKVGSKVVLCLDDKNRDINEDEDGYPKVASHWGVGEVIEVRAKGTRRYKVRWSARGTELWMRNRDLLNPEESKNPSLPCCVCMKYTRLCCGQCQNDCCSRHLKNGRCGHCSRKSESP